MTEPDRTVADKFLHDDALTVKRSAWASKWLWLVGLIALAGIGAWWMTHPGGFAPRGRLSEQTPVDTPLFVAVLGPSNDSARTVELRDVSAAYSGPGGTDVTVLICRGGSIGTTTDAAPFCPQLVEAKGEEFHYGERVAEQLVLRVQAPVPGTVTVDGVDLTFREGLQFGTVRVGPHLTLTILGH